MAQQKYEVCHIKNAERKPEPGKKGCRELWKDFWTLSVPKEMWVYQYVAETPSPTGVRIIATSRAVEDVWEYQGSVSPDDMLRVHDLRNELYHEVLQQLLADGWEPVGTDEQGKITSFRRPV